MLNKMFLSLLTAVMLSTSGIAVAKADGLNTDVRPMDEIQCEKKNGVWGCIIYVT